MACFEKNSLKSSYCPFDNIKHIDLNFLSINKKHIKIQILLLMKSNTSLHKIFQINIPIY